MSPGFPKFHRTWIAPRRAVCPINLFSVEYSAGWAEVQNDEHYTGVVVYSSTPGRYVKIKFVGRFFGLVYQSNTGAPYLEIDIDGVAYDDLDMYSSALYNDRAYTVTETLSEGPHTATLTISSEKNPDSTGYLCRLNGYIADGAWNPLAITRMSYYGEEIPVRVWGTYDQKLAQHGTAPYPLIVKVRGYQNYELGQDGVTPYELLALLKGEDSGGTKRKVLVDTGGRLILSDLDLLQRRLKFVDQKGLTVDDTSPTQFPSVACQAVAVIGHPDNTDEIFVGGSDVAKTAGNANCGFPISKTLGKIFDVNTNANELYGLADVDDEALCLVMYEAVS